MRVEYSTYNPPQVGNALTISAMEAPRVVHMHAPRIQHHTAYVMAPDKKVVSWQYRQSDLRTKDRQSEAAY